jgi:three-Cys-motif partner protein
MIALGLSNKFDHYIFNDLSEPNISALKHRIGLTGLQDLCSFYNEDANSCIETILNERPLFDNGKRNLTFCFLDPFSLNLSFDTVRVLARENVDILMLHALQMDGNRNLTYYIKEENERIEKFTGNPARPEGGPRGP